MTNVSITGEMFQPFPIHWLSSKSDEIGLSFLWMHFKQVRIGILYQLNWWDLLFRSNRLHKITDVQKGIKVIFLPLQPIWQHNTYNDDVPCMALSITLLIQSGIVCGRLAIHSAGVSHSVSRKCAKDLKAADINKPCFTSLGPRENSLKPRSYLRSMNKQMSK